jgi:hypothetical protein
MRAHSNHSLIGLIFNTTSHLHSSAFHASSSCTPNHSKSHDPKPQALSLSQSQLPWIFTIIALITVKHRLSTRKTLVALPMLTMPSEWDCFLIRRHHVLCVPFQCPHYYVLLKLFKQNGSEVRRTRQHFQ